MKYLTEEKGQEAEGWMRVAAMVAERALCRKAKCGTIIVQNGEVIGEGYNAPPLDREENRTCGKEYGPGKPGYDQTCCVHAEWRAIMDALKRNGKKISGAKLYFVRIDKEGKIKKSRKPYCTVCSRLALDACIGTFMLWHDEGIAEYTTAEYDLLSHEYIHPN